MKNWLYILLFISGPISAQDTLMVHHVDDFPINGQANHPAWQQSKWYPLPARNELAKELDSRFKLLYSDKGIYVYMEGKDQKISTTFQNDFEDLYQADVFEVFFHPNPSAPVYFEYEINPLEKELVLMVPNFQGKFYGWLPWHYEGERKVQKKVSVKHIPGSIGTWSAELFIPFALLTPLENVPAKPGMVWKGNFCRLDYDTGKMAKWSWSPLAGTFHDYKKYGVFLFK
ncbi:hypothetical protein EWU23_07730 [Cytophagaceae bacterium 50C-KIRBA]|uniref:Carbohydrate-binding domain-containing protein n=1 Tax=Aquirufa beregesia TaxID=2516556 RepID=A0ABX0EWS4_9BACT|nr:carbohydrate-binding family 9-like protein [Aquirufa beregesia]NGZ44360.1 hypothetical protein [Aquirufa beregesia]